MNVARRRALLLATAMGATALIGLPIGPRRLAGEGDAIDLQRIFPTQFGAWTLDQVAAAFVRPADDLTNSLYSQLLERTFIDTHGRRVMLSVAYGREQAAGLQLHWPEVCYRYAGYAVYGRHLASVDIGGKDEPVTRLVAELPMRPEAVTYWSVLGRERIADNNTYRLRQLSHSVRREIPDGLLVRVSSIDPITERAYALQADFIDALLQAMMPQDRARVVGVPPRG